MFKNRKKRSSVVKNKLEKNIKKRLMTLSLKVDHYIYKNRPITAAEATSYYHEVMSYQTLCKHDERSLQVIEKLLHFMRAIIKEQTCNDYETYISEKLMQDVADRQISPVYSLTEDDKFESQTTGDDEFVSFEQHQGGMNNQNHTNSVVRGDESSLVGAHNNSDDDRTQMDIEMQVLAKENITTDNGQIFHESNDTNCNTELELQSQSILNNIILPNTKNLNLDCGQDINKIIDKTQNYNIIDTNRLSDAMQGSSIKPTDKNHTTEAISKTKNNEKKIVNVNVKKKIKKPKKTTVKTTKQQKQQNVENKKTTKPNEKKIKKKSKKITSKMKTDNYSKGNLAWINDIKFVREITHDEYEPSLTALGETLWKNCELPISWKDFEL